MYYLSFKLKGVLYLFIYIIYFKQFIYLAIKPFLNVVNRKHFFIKVSVPAPFRHGYCFKSTGYVPVSDKNQTIPIPNYHTTGEWDFFLSFIDILINFYMRTYKLLKLQIFL